jgi:hypothetical protein
VWAIDQLQAFLQDRVNRDTQAIAELEKKKRMLGLPQRSSKAEYKSAFFSPSDISHYEMTAADGRNACAARIAVVHPIWRSH